jgi:hypothetical protein
MEVVLADGTFTIYPTLAHRAESISVDAVNSAVGVQ